MGQHNILTGGTGDFRGPPARRAVLVEQKRLKGDKKEENARKNG
jgi:hypothetical protein